MIFNCYKSFSLFIFLVIPRIFPAFSQPSDLYSYIQMKHGLDLNLVNGILYYDKYKNVLNHPFYSGEEFLTGSVVISGIRYKDVQINYDIYSQYLVLEYPDFSGSSYSIIISPEHTDAFDFDGNSFKKLILDDRGPLFYQLIKVNGLICYIHWKKKKTTRSYQSTDFFTETEQGCFLDYYGNISPFSNRRNFVSLISGVPQKEIIRYIRKKGIQLSDATPEQLEDLLQFITSSIHSTSGN
jgi:hypothetical protein